MPILFLLAGFALGTIVAFLAWKARALSRSGAWAAALTGGLIFGLGGLSWAVLLLVFFVSSSLLSRAFAARKAGVNEKFSKGSRRDWAQVLANGSLGALLVVVHALLPDQSWPWLAFTGAMAAANADTWATELGVLSPTPPRSLLTGGIVEGGTSGAVSLLGSLAGLGGALLVGLAALLFSPQYGSGLLLATGLGGLAGSFFDSLLGATIQAIYYCPACRKETERHPLHLCGTPTTPLRGLGWVNNDLVNFACSIAGALVTLGIYQLFF